MQKNQKFGGMNSVYSECSELDDLLFVIHTAINEINTVIPVKVVEVYVSGSEGPTGYVDVVPLVGDTDTDGELIDMATLYHLPYFRLQGGIVAIVTDPVVGDIGLAAFAQTDTSNVVVGTEKTVTPGSFRTYSMSDGWYLGGFLCQKPKAFLELNQDETCTLTAESGITINVDGGCTINANTGGMTINCEDGGLLINGHTTIIGDLTVDDVPSYDGHVHPCPHGGNTGGPQ